jgi:hypothetical protein
VVFVYGIGVNGSLRGAEWRRGSQGRIAALCPTCRGGSHSLPLRADADLSLPGMAQIVADFIAALKLDEITLVANDTGGAVAQSPVGNDICDLSSTHRASALSLRPARANGIAEEAAAGSALPRRRLRQRVGSLSAAGRAQASTRSPRSLSLPASKSRRALAVPPTRRRNATGSSSSVNAGLRPPRLDVLHRPSVSVSW